MSLVTHLKKIVGLTLLLALGVSTSVHAAPTALQSRAFANKQSPITRVNSDIEYTRLVVKFKEGLWVRPGTGGLLQGNLLPKGKSLPGLDNTLFQSELANVNNFFSSKGMQLNRKFALPETTLDQLRERGQKRLGRELADLNLYFELPIIGKNPAMIEQMVNFLNGLSVVEIAYAQPKDEPASISPNFQDYDPVKPTQAFQGYLNPSSEGGIDAKYAWTVPGGRGQGVKIVDVERGWNSTHEDLPEMFHRGGEESPSSDPSDRNHGTAVLGVIAAVDNGFGVTGIVPDAQIGYASHPTFGTPGAILNAADAVGEGGIVVIEVHRRGPTLQQECECNNLQCNYIAIEYWQADFDAIQTATANGVIVVEAAGNGTANFDDPIYQGLFDRNVRDSGAIVVGASASTSREPMCWTNYGQRVDLHAWGENVMTLGYGSAYKKADDPDNQNYWYSSDFSGTSSATPIVVGAVAALQGISLAKNGGLLTASELSQLLKSTGVEQDVGLDRKIGVFPDLNAAINKPIFTCQEYTATNNQHEAAGRAYKQNTTSWWLTTSTWYAEGSDQNLGTSGLTSVTLHEAAPGYFAQGSCPVPDTTAPVITLNGANPQEVIQGGTYQEFGATATDDRDGNISDQVVISGIVNTAQLGEYTRYYNVSDAAGNAAKTVTRTVRVISAPACQEYTATNSQHEAAGRATKESKSSWWTTTSTWYANGSNDNLGTLGTTTHTLKEQPAGSGHFSLGNCPTGPQPPVIDWVQTSVNGADVTITGGASDPDGDLAAIVLLFGGGGFQCDLDNPVGSTGSLSYDCSNMANWSITLHDLPEGNYSHYQVKAVDSNLNQSEFVTLNFTIYGQNAPVIDWVNTQVNGRDVTITGGASDPDGDLAAIVLLFGGGGFQCDLDNPVGSTGSLSYDCSNMANWSITLHDLPEGNYSHYQVKAVDSNLNQSDLVTLNFTIEESQQACFKATNTVHGSAGRATLKYNVLYYSNGENDYLGMGVDTTSLLEVSAGRWKLVTTCP